MVKGGGEGRESVEWGGGGTVRGLTGCYNGKKNYTKYFMVVVSQP